MSNALVKIRNLHFSRGSQKIFNDVSLDIPRGKITAIMGPSGTGKTTLLKLIGAQLDPDSGFVEFDGDNIHTLSRRRLYQVRKKMGMLFQSGALFTNLNVFENVAFPILEHTNLSRQMVRDLVMMKLEAVGLRGAEKLMPSELSGGMARRVALARAIALDPQIIMYDEPFTGQDPITMGVLLKLIKLLNDAVGITSVLVSHDVQEAASISDYVYLISGGRVIGQGEPQTLLSSQAPEIKQFVQGLPDGPVPFRYPSRDLRDVLLSKEN